MLLQGRRALITGASRGIGRAIAERFAREGARLLLTSRTGGLEGWCGPLRDQGAEIHTLQGELREGSFRKELVKEARGQLGGLDILVNNAGILRDGPLGMVADSDLRDLWDTNVEAVYQLTQLAIRLMEGDRRPSIVNLASLAGTRGLEGAVAYSASKGALVAFTRAAAKELAPRGIRVNALSPGFIDTDLTAGLPQVLRARRIQAVGLGRAGRPEEVAAAALFLASELSSYVTGQVLGVDGGMQA